MWYKSRVLKSVVYKYKGEVFCGFSENLSKEKRLFIRVMNHDIMLNIMSFDK